jgi:hypothetical protein
MGMLSSNGVGWCWRRGMDDVELLEGMRKRLAFLYSSTAGSFEMIRRVRGHALLA